MAYFITFTTFGSWLHGDDRGSHSRKGDTVRQRIVAPNPALEAQMRLRMKHSEFRLDDEARKCVHEAIVDQCKFRKWMLHALNVRTNHVHVVVGAPGQTGSKVLGDLKARATRVLRERGLVAGDQPVWTERGSKVVLDSPEGFRAAVHYVLHEQD